MSTQPVDVVIAWVDGDDPAHRAKRQQYGGKVAASHNDVGGDMRFRATGEIYFCIASVLRYAPWVRKIWIVTDNQDPHAYEFVERNFPDNKIPIEIVDHKVLFRGYEQLLPTFNSLAISTMLWRIPGLADRYLYFNDDVFLASPATPQMWFEGEQTTIYARKVPALFARLLRWGKHLGKKHKIFGHKDPMLNAADLLRSGYFFLFPHAPVPMRRSWYERYFGDHPDLLYSNICHRFREPSQFSSPTLFYVSAYREGKLTVRSPKGTTCFFKPSVEKKGGYMARKIAEADGNKALKFGCINSLGETTREEQDMFNRWICAKLDITL